MRSVLLPAFVVLAACASPESAPPPEPAEVEESLLPGTIGVVVRRGEAGVVVAAARQGVPLREGDLILRYNGVAVKTPRQFNGLVADSNPGDLAEVEFLREGAVRRIELPVRQLDIVPRV